MFFFEPESSSIPLEFSPPEARGFGRVHRFTARVAGDDDQVAGEGEPDRSDKTGMTMTSLMNKVQECGAGGYGVVPDERSVQNRR